MENPEETLIELIRRYIKIVWKRKFWILAIVSLFMLFTLGFSYDEIKTPKYKTTIPYQVTYTPTNLASGYVRTVHLDFPKTVLAIVNENINLNYSNEFIEFSPKFEASLKKDIIYLAVVTNSAEVGHLLIENYITNVNKKISEFVYLLNYKKIEIIDLQINDNKIVIDSLKRKMKWVTASSDNSKSNDIDFWAEKTFCEELINETIKLDAEKKLFQIEYENIAYLEPVVSQSAAVSLKVNPIKKNLLLSFIFSLCGSIILFIFIEDGWKKLKDLMKQNSKN